MPRRKNIVNCFLCIKRLRNGQDIPIFTTPTFESDEKETSYMVKVLEKALTCKLEEKSMISKVICKACNILIIQYEETVKKSFQLLEEIKNIYLLNNPLNTDFKCDEDENETISALNNSETLVLQPPANNDVKSEQNCSIENISVPTNVTDTLDLIKDTEINSEDSSEMNDTGCISPYESENDDNKDEEEVALKNLPKIKISKAKKPRTTSKKGVQNTTKKVAVKSADVDAKINKFMILSCHMCSQRVDNFAELRNHFRSVHNRSGYAFCCNTKIFKRCRLSDHIDTHLNPDTFKCDTCAKTFNTREYLHLHMRNLHSELKVAYQCNQCPKKFAWKSMLDAHKHIHTPKESWCIKCDECGKTFATKYFLAAHKHSVHYSKDNLKICHICGKNVSNKMFKRHQKTHSGIDEPRVQCEICGTWLKNQRYLKIHLENHQESMVDHICTTCGKNSPNRRALAKHIRDTHTESRIHKCNICEKSFKRRLLLTQHITTHTGEFLYKCPYCPKSFTYDSTFHVHKKKEHPIQFAEDKLKRGARTNCRTATVEKSDATIVESPILKCEDNFEDKLAEVLNSAGTEPNYFQN